MPLSPPFIDWLLGLLVMDSLADKLNTVSHERLHIWKTSLACWIVLGETLPWRIFFPLLYWGCMHNGICSVPLLFCYTSRLLHVVPMVRDPLLYYEWLILSQVGLTVFGWYKFIQICGHRMIGEEEFLIALSNLGLLLPIVIVYPIVEDEIIWISCTFPLWGFLKRFVLLSLYFLL